MLGRDEAVSNLNRIRRSATNISLWSQIKACSWLNDNTWATIYDDQMPKDRIAPVGNIISRCRLLKVARNCNHDLHQKEVEKNDE